MEDTNEDRITLLAIEMATQLKYGSEQSRLYLAQAKMKFKKQNETNDNENKLSSRNRGYVQ